MTKFQFFVWKYGAWEGTDNRVETYALWILLKVAIEKGIRTLQLLGDSKPLMDWKNGIFHKTLGLL